MQFFPAAWRCLAALRVLSMLYGIVKREMHSRLFGGRLSEGRLTLYEAEV